jgi:dCMP deaminase
MLQVLGIGYNGNAKGLSNGCDSEEVGNCGCLHAEINALLKAPGTVERKVMFVTVAPCIMCAKAIVNSNVSNVYWRQYYRDDAGLKLLFVAGVFTAQLYPEPLPVTLSPSTI